VRSCGSTLCRPAAWRPPYAFDTALLQAAIWSKAFSCRGWWQQPGRGRLRTAESTAAAYAPSQSRRSLRGRGSGHAFVQRLGRRHYELRAELQPHERIASPSTKSRSASDQTSLKADDISLTVSPIHERKDRAIREGAANDPPLPLAPIVG
jgi:hypothetical protein